MNKEELKSYLSSKYQGSEWFLDNVIHPVFGDTGDDDVDSGELLDKYPELKPVAKRTGISSVKEIWEIFVGMQPLLIFDVTVSDHIMMNRNRVGVQTIVKRIMDKYSYAFMIFHYDDNDTQWDWRFSYCHKGAKESDTTESKRFTFLLGPGQTCLTAASNFMKLEAKHGEISDEDLETAFSVEALSNEFFDKYKKRYEKFVSYITGKAYVKTGGKYVEKVVNNDNDKQLYAAFGNDDKRVRDYVKRLLGRVLFLHFVQKKGWLGLPDGEAWNSGKGDLDFMRHLYNEASPEQRDDFLDTVLEPLFNAIDTNRVDNGYLYDTKVFGSLRVPYLNGGLFERDADDEIPSRFPKEYFADLLEFFSQYNFTVDENDPNDAQVGIDPEMLSRIFENLLEDNKDKGAYYTPKEVVHHMCRESLIAYLQTRYDDAHGKAIRRFVEIHDASALELSTPSETMSFKNEIDQRLREVKVCDPAIGSGAFPMGMLKEIFLCRCALEEVTENAEIKRQIIQNNIYGVDIEKGAVEIARLRFWLSLIVDETSPETLPNLDFKIMQGNSLITTFRGQYVDLDTKHDFQRQSYTKIMQNMRQLTKEQNAFYNSNSKERSEHEINIKHLILDSIISQLDYEFGSWRATNYATPNIFGGKAEKGKKSKYAQDFSKERMDILSDCRKLDEELMDSSKSLKVRSQIAVPFFDWHIMFNDVFNRPNKQGFDIVIGNPPYIKEGRANKTAFDGFRETKYYQGKMDLWYGFACLSIDMLTFDGILCFIATNNWTTNAGASILRNKVINDTQILSLIDFGSYMVFEDSASIQTMIMLFKKETKADNYSFDYRKLNKQNASRQEAMALLTKSQKEALYLTPRINRDNLRNSLLTFSSDDKEAILDKIAENAAFLDSKDATNGIHPHYDFVSNKIARKYPFTKVGDGIFALSKSEKDNLHLSEAEEKLIKPYYTGEDIHRYYTSRQNKFWIIYTSSDFKNPHSMDAYPHLKAHLDFYKDVITSDNKPYGLHRAREERFFKGEKIVCQRMCVGRPSFSYSNFNAYVSATFYVINTSRFNLKYLTGLLNSKLVFFWLYNRGKMKGDNFQVDKEPLMQIPIKTNNLYEPSVIKYVSSILTKMSSDLDADISLEEKYIDLLVFHIYDLSYDEVLVVDPQTPISREEYDKVDTI